MLIKKWRNEQISVLRQNKILTDEDQYKYYNDVILPSMAENQPHLILFSYLLSGCCIGYGGFTNIDWIARKAEISFLLDTERAADPKLYQNEFSIFLGLVKKNAFNELNLNRLFTETFDIRPVHVDTLLNNGFELEGKLRQHVVSGGEFVNSLIHGCLKENYSGEVGK